MDIERIDQTVADIGNKKLSGALSPDERNRFYALVNLDLLKLNAGLPEDYLPGQPISAQGFQVTFKNSDNLRNLLKHQDINRNAAGYFPVPPDYAAFDYMLYGYVYNDDCGEAQLSWKRVEAVTGGERAIRLESHIIPPTPKKPIVSWTMNGFKVDPSEVKQVRLHYIKYPRTPFRAYTMNANDEDIYNPVGSTNTDWPDTMFGDFVIRVCKYAGINLREAELVQFGLQRQTQGQ